MTTGKYTRQAEVTGQCTHHHHLARNIVKRHAQQSGIACPEAKEATGYAGRGLHTLFLHLHRLGSSRRATGMHQYRRAVIVPFG